MPNSTVPNSTTPLELLRLPSEVLARIWPENRVVLGEKTSKALAKIILVPGKRVEATLDCEGFLGRNLPLFMRQETSQHKVARFLVKHTKYGMPIRLVWRLDGHREKFRERCVSSSDVLARIFFEAGGNLRGRKIMLRELVVEDAFDRDSMRGPMLLRDLQNTEIEVLHLNRICPKGFGSMGWPYSYAVLNLRRLVVEGLECLTCGNVGCLGKMLSSGAASEFRMQGMCPDAVRFAMFSLVELAQPEGAPEVSHAQRLEFDQCDTGNGRNGVEITERLVRGLARRDFPSLTHLSFAGSRLYLQAVAGDFVRALSRMPLLRVLDLSGSRIGSPTDGLGSLLEAIAARPALEHVDLSHAGIGQAGADMLVVYLRASSSLQTLGFRGTDYEVMCTLPATFMTVGTTCRILPAFVTVEPNPGETTTCLSPPFPEGARRVYVGGGRGPLITGPLAMIGELHVTRSTALEYRWDVDIFRAELSEDGSVPDGSEVSSSDGWETPSEGE